MEVKNIFQSLLTVFRDIKVTGGDKNAAIL